MSYSALLHELADELGVALPRTLMVEAQERITHVFRSRGDDITLPVLTLKLVRALAPLFGTQLKIGSQQERQIVLALEPQVEQLLS
jgi:hypothetical protein